MVVALNIDDLDADLFCEHLVYLGSPYSRYEAGLEAAARDACRVAGALLRQGVRVFSPIAHSHAIAMAAGIDPLNHGIWLSADEPMMRAASALIVAEMPGWSESYGLAYEIDFFRRAGKRIYRLPFDAGVFA